MPTKHKKKPSASFAAKAAKKLNPSEEAVEAILPIWASPYDRKRLYFNSGFNAETTMEDDSYKEWTAQPITREALNILMDASVETRFGMGIFSAAHGKGTPTHLYVISHDGKAVIAGPEEISDKLKEKLKAAGAEYVAQSDKAGATDKINTFLAKGYKDNLAINHKRWSAQDQVEMLIHSFVGCEAPNPILTGPAGNGAVVAKGMTVGTFIAYAGNPANTMHTVDLDRPKVPQPNLMFTEEKAKAQALALAQAPVAQTAAASPKPR